jgi:hypothetical protein
MFMRRSHHQQFVANTLRQRARRRLTLESLEHRSLLALAQLSYAATDLLGNAVTELVQGREYFLNASVQDLRGTSATGVSSAYFDLTVNENARLTVINQTGAIGGVIFSPLYPNNRSGVNNIEIAAEEINEVGATTTENYFDNSVQLFQMRFRADATGTLTFGSNPGELTASIFALQGFGPIASSDVNFATLSLPIVAAITLTNNSSSVNEDSSITLDVLANDTGGSSRWTIEAVGDISSGGAVTIASNGKSLTYTPAANFSGTETFKYFTVDGNGIHGQATVTMTVNPVNDAPVNTVPGLQTFTSTNRTVTFGPLNSLSTSDVDVGTGKVRVTLFVNSGRIVLGSTTGLTFRSGSNNSKYMLFDATLTNANNALLNARYIANSTTTSDILTLDVHDLGNTGSGGARIDRDSVNIVLASQAPNKAPVNSVPGPQTYTSSSRTVIFDSSRPISTSDADAGTAKVRVTLFVNNGILTLPSTVGLTFINGGNATKYMLFDGTIANVNNALVNLRYVANVGSQSDTLTIDTNDLGNTGSGGSKVDRDSILLTLQGSTTFNSPPVNSVPGAQTYGSTTRTVTFGSSNQVSVSDPNTVGTSLNLRVTLFVNNGSITLPTTAGLSFLSGANGTRYLLFDGTQANINNALLNMQYTAAASSNADVFTIDTHDLGNTGAGGALTDRDTISLSLVGTSSSSRSAGNGSGEASSVNTAAILPPETSTTTSAASTTSQSASTTDTAFSDGASPTSPLLAIANTTAVRLADLLASTNLGRQKAQSVDALFASDA